MGTGALGALPPAAGTPRPPLPRPLSPFRQSIATGRDPLGTRATQIWGSFTPEMHRL